MSIFSFSFALLYGLIGCNFGLPDTGEGDSGAPASTEDADQDGFTEADGDCDDDNPLIHPDAQETWYDGIDQDCDGGSDYDQDGDGFEDGEDCNDEDASINPDAADTTADGEDQDCDGIDGDGSGGGGNGGNGGGGNGGGGSGGGGGSIDVAEYDGTFNGRAFSQRCDDSNGTFYNMTWDSGGRTYLLLQCRNVDYWVNMTVSFPTGEDSSIVGVESSYPGPRLYADVTIYDNGNDFCTISNRYSADVLTEEWNPETGRWSGSFESRCDDGHDAHDVSGTFSVTL